MSQEKYIIIIMLLLLQWESCKFSYLLINFAVYKQLNDNEFDSNMVRITFQVTYFFWYMVQSYQFKQTDKKKKVVYFNRTFSTNLLFQKCHNTLQFSLHFHTGHEIESVSCGKSFSLRVKNNCNKVKRLWLWLQDQGCSLNCF